MIDSAVKKAVHGDPVLNGRLWVSRSGEVGPDFFDIDTDTWWDVTTHAAWMDHVWRYTDTWGVGIGLFTG